MSEGGGNKEWMPGDYRNSKSWYWNARKHTVQHSAVRAYSVAFSDITEWYQECSTRLPASSVKKSYQQSGSPIVYPLPAASAVRQGGTVSCFSNEHLPSGVW